MSNAPQAPCLIVPGDNFGLTMAKSPMLYHWTNIYALWTFGFPQNSPLSIKHNCYHPRNRTWAICTHAGQILYTFEGSPSEAFNNSPILQLWLAGTANDTLVNNETAKFIRKANMHLVSSGRRAGHSAR